MTTTERTREGRLTTIWLPEGRTVWEAQDISGANSNGPTYKAVECRALAVQTFELPHGGTE